MTRKYEKQESVVCLNVSEELFGGETPLLSASARGHLSTVGVLIENRADIGLSDERGRSFVGVASGCCAQLFDAIKERARMDLAAL